MGNVQRWEWNDTCLLYLEQVKEYIPKAVGKRMVVWKQTFEERARASIITHLWLIFYCLVSSLEHETQRSALDVRALC